jgi:hypothetical protein
MEMNFVVDLSKINVPDVIYDLENIRHNIGKDEQTVTLVTTLG